MRREAKIDKTGRYRYSLVRIWDEDGQRAVFVMLNPSTADARKDDPTIRRCIGFARKWGYGSLEVVNIFALRATFPNMLLGALDPVGPRNDRYLLEAVNRADLIVVAWGELCGNGKFTDRGHHVRKLLAGQFMLCLGETKFGQPKHPLYLKASTSLITPSGFCN